MNRSFRSFNLSQSTISALEAMGFEEPTPIQAEAIPTLLDGRDVVAQARTGTGKTAAFGIPLVDSVKGRRVQAIVMVPTRELANQVADELNAIGRGSQFKAEAIYGGVGYGRQKAALRGDAGVTCVVACPGRLLDILDNDRFDLSSVRTVVLDEADRMLDMGFVNDIERILDHLPHQRQTVLTSATMPDGIRRLASKYLTDPETVTTTSGALATPLTDQYLVEVNGLGFAPLLSLLDAERPERAVIFTDTKHTAKRIGAKLKAAGHRADTLQGNMSQKARDRTMADFRRGRVQVLVATDVAARGIDVDELTHVIQFDVPKNPEDHVHRTGRTGRAGREGRAFLFAQPEHERSIRRIEQHAGVELKTYDLGYVPDLQPHVAAAGPKPRNYESVTAGGRGGGGGGGKYRGRRSGGNRNGGNRNGGNRNGGNRNGGNRNGGNRNGGNRNGGNRHRNRNHGGGRRNGGRGGRHHGGRGQAPSRRN